jgi:L-alanine-DL-glutamate epimerase-like enolase superfamily enzyme
MKITKIDCHVLLIPDYDSTACSSAQDDLVVEIHTDDGLVVIGETDTNPWVARECIRAPGTHCMGLGLAEMLIGADPMEPEMLWQKLYSGSKMTGRRGAVICAIGALDMALWDLKAKVLGKPVCELLGGSTKNPVTPYASLLPVGDTVAEQRESLIAKSIRVRELGFKAAKLEVCINGPYSHNGLQAPDDDGVAIVAACREAVGPDFTLMVDVAYAWPNAEHALRVLEKLAPYNLFFLETPIDIDDIEGHAMLAERSPIPIAAGEWQNTHWEFVELADRGKLAVLQPDVGRVGGFTEAMKVCRLAEARNRQIVPHCWKSAIGIAASAHVAASTSVCPYIEFLPAELSESPLRRELTTPEFTIRDGLLQLSTEPGLGIELNREAVKRFSV